jgi:hypothetical protein
MVRAGLVIALIGAAIGGAPAQIDILAALETNLREAQNSIFSSFATGAIAFSGNRSVFKAATLEQRAVMVRTAVAIARTFTASREFGERYALYREAQRPQRSTAARTGDEARANQQQAIELAVGQALATATQLPPDARARLDASIADMRRQIAELNADPAYRAQVDEAAAAAAREDDADYARRLAQFASEYPESANVMIAQRLRQFLLACSDVDFAAKIEPGGGFANRAYERRSAEWKMCYRAGKPAVDAARAAAEEWLNALRQLGF